MPSQRRRRRDEGSDTSACSDDFPAPSVGTPSSSPPLSSLRARSTSGCSELFPDSPPSNSTAEVQQRDYSWNWRHAWLFERCLVAVEHGQTFAHLDDFAARAGKYGDAGHLTSDTVKAIAKASHEAILGILNGYPYCCLAFDGAMWKHDSADGQHILVTTAHCAKASYVLPPNTQLEAWTAANVGGDFDRITSDVEETTLKHFVIDGTFEITASTDAADAIAAYFEEFAPKAAAPACLDLRPETRKLREALKEQFREKWPHVPYLLCLGNYVRCRVVDVQRTWAGQGDAADLVANICESLFSLECASVRRARLKRFICVKSQAALAKATAARSAIADVLVMLCGGLGFMDTRMLRTNIADGIRAFAPHLLEKIDSIESFFSSDERAWEVPMLILRSRLDDYIQAMERQSTATRLAAGDPTRWHFGAFRAYGFVLVNLDALQEFYAEETHPTSGLIVEAIAQNKEKIRQELQEYVASLAPANLFLTAISRDARRGMHLLFFPSFARMQRQLSEQRDGTPGRELYKRIAREVDTLNGPEPRRRGGFFRLKSTLKFHFFAQFLQPGYSRFCEDEWFKSRNGVIDAKEFREGLGFTEDELPATEFDDYWSMCKSDSTLSFTSCVAAREWWLSQSERFPNLREVALYVMRVPSITTRIDSAISVVGSMFPPQQNGIDTATAAELVALRCNGDVGGQLPQGTWTPSWP